MTVTKVKATLVKEKSMQKRQLRKLTRMMIKLQLTMGDTVNQNFTLTAHRDFIVFVSKNCIINVTRDYISTVFRTVQSSSKRNCTITVCRHYAVTVLKIRGMNIIKDYVVLDFVGCTLTARLARKRCDYEFNNG